MRTIDENFVKTLADSNVLLFGPLLRFLGGGGLVFVPILVFSFRRGILVGRFSDIQSAIRDGIFCIVVQSRRFHVRFGIMQHYVTRSHEWSSIFFATIAVEMKLFVR
jgi:hypothetical protein